MKKYILLVRGSRQESYEEFAHRIEALSSGYLESLRPAHLKYVLTEAPPPTFSVIPYRKSRIASISIYGDDSLSIPGTGLPEDLAGCYRVDEVLPVKYDKTWPNGKVTPGVCLLTLFSGRKDIPYETFIDRWHNSHTPLSLRIHPLWNYNRNVVLETSPETKDPFQGIVEEHFREDRDLKNPFRFFGPPHLVLGRMLAVYRDTKAFIDYPGMETFWCREYILS